MIMVMYVHFMKTSNKTNTQVLLLPVRNRTALFSPTTTTSSSSSLFLLLLLLPSSPFSLFLFKNVYIFKLFDISVYIFESGFFYVV